MTAPSLDILAPLYKSAIEDSEITDLLGQFLSGPAIFTRRPVPDDAGSPSLVIGPIITRDDQDGVSDYRPRVMIDLSVYGSQPAQYRDVESLGDILYRKYHRQRDVIAVDNYSVTQITCFGPVPAPTDDESGVARRVQLTITLASL